VESSKINQEEDKVRIWVLKHPESKFFPWCERASFTPIQNNKQNYSYAYLERSQEDK
jgi:hypothetical protein